MATQKPLLFFVHIPKTAGTSFRIALEQAFGTARCHFDYGLEAPETTPLVRELALQRPDLFRFGRRLARADARLLCGHVPVGRYLPLAGCSQTITFVREPLQQLLSHHAHQQRLLGYPGGLLDFAHGPQGGGLQAEMLAGVPLEALGFVGVTERYADSLRVFNASQGEQIVYRDENRNPDKPAEASYPVPDGQREALAACTAPARRLYARANALLDQRLAALEAGQPFVHGALSGAQDGWLRGFAFEAGTQRPVALELWANGQLLAQGRAVEDAPALRALRAPRLGYVGFALALPRPLRAGEPAELRVAGSGQRLWSR